MSNLDLVFWRTSYDMIALPVFVRVAHLHCQLPPPPPSSTLNPFEIVVCNMAAFFLGFSMLMEAIPDSNVPLRKNLWFVLHCFYRLHMQHALRKLCTLQRNTIKWHVYIAIYKWIIRNIRWANKDILARMKPCIKSRHERNGLRTHVWAISLQKFNTWHDTTPG